MDYVTFKIGNVPVCFWGNNLKERNRTFLQTIDPNYYAYTARVHRNHLNTDSRMLAALALRLNYYQALETFFTLVGAGLQAPFCLYGWIQKARDKKIKTLLRRINARNESISNALRLDTVSWYEIAKRIHQDVDVNANHKLNLIRFFGETWEFFGREFLSESSQSEYEELKLGKRLIKSAGVFDLEKFSVADSTLLSKFNKVYDIDQSGKVYQNNHYAEDCNISWYPDFCYSAALMLRDSINNLLSFLKEVNGITKPVPQFYYPADFTSSKSAVDQYKQLNTVFEHSEKIAKSDIYPMSANEMENNIRSIQLFRRQAWGGRLH
ncbi:MAG: hypothetical protein U5R06_23355 [candidate division KSB1 bacterium]|nr:hypothetical protein [candidate division KSB1 bacterium]